MSEPQQWTEVLRDGSRVLIRPIRSSDVARNAAFIEGLSPPSKHFLFLGGISQLTEGELQHLCNPDAAHDMVYVALAGPGAQERQVGVCRYAGADPVHGAEISVAVADDWQHKGLGKLLLTHLIDYARNHGVKRLYSMDTANNVRMRKLALHIGFSEQPDPDNVRQVIFSRDLP